MDEKIQSQHLFSYNSAKEQENTGEMVYSAKRDTMTKPVS